MKVLFDTQAFLWAVSDDPQLSSTARAIFVDPKNEVIVSVASVWEMIVKAVAGKLPIPRPANSYIRAQLTKTSVAVLPILLHHALHVENLPMHHRDPFDRIILSQALEEKIPIVSSDRKFRLYPVQLIW